MQISCSTMCTLPQFSWFNKWIMDSSVYIDSVNTLYQSQNHPWRDVKVDVQKTSTKFQSMHQTLQTHYNQLSAVSNEQIYAQQFIINSEFLRHLPSFKAMTISNGKVFIRGDIERDERQYTKKQCKLSEGEKDFESQRQKLKTLLSSQKSLHIFTIEKSNNYCPTNHWQHNLDPTVQCSKCQPLVHVICDRLGGIFTQDDFEDDKVEYYCSHWKNHRMLAAELKKKHGWPPHKQSNQVCLLVCVLCLVRSTAFRICKVSLM